jgi:hypothetical protein
LEVTVPAGVNIGDAFQFVIGAPTEQPSIGADPSMALQRLHSVQQLAQAEGGDRPRILAEYEGALGDLMPLLRTAPDPDGSLRREVTEALDIMDALQAAAISASPAAAAAEKLPASQRLFRFNSPRLRRPSLEAEAECDEEEEDDAGGGLAESGMPLAHQLSHSMRTDRVQAFTEPAQEERWQLLIRQTAPHFLPPQKWLEAINQTNENAPNFSKVSQMDFGPNSELRFASSSGEKELRFMLKWPGSSEHPADQIWAQTSDPFTSQGTVSGYRAISAPYSEQGWRGLARSKVACLDGSCDDRWYYAVGSPSDWNGGLPGPNSMVRTVELWVAAPLPVLPLGRLAQMDAASVLRQQVELLHTTAIFQG